MPEVDREAMLASALRLAKLGSWAWTLETDQLWLSPEALRILGLDEGDFDGTFSSLLRRMHPEDVPQLRKIAGQMRSRQRSYSYRCRIYAADGSLKMVRGDGEAQFDAGGKVCRLVGTVLDETERQEFRERLRDIEETSHEWFWEQDEQHRFTKVTGGKYRRPFGDPQTTIGKTRWEIPGAVPLSSTWQAHIATLEARKSFREFEYRVGEGEFAFVLSASGHPTYDAAGNFRGYKGSALNITRRIDAERQAQEQQALLEKASRLGNEQLRELTDRLTTTLESITDAFFTLDRDWRFSYINREAEKLLGRSREDLRGQVVWQEFPTEIGGPFHLQYERALAEFKTVEFEEFSTVLGLWLHVVAYPSLQGLAVYFRDVTESRRVREALAESEERYRLEILALNQDLSQRVQQRTAELMAANTELRGFAHSLAHDLRAPVAVIDGFSGRLEECLRAAGAERELHYLQRIRAAGRRMDEYIDALLSLATISQANLQLRDVDLSAMASAILSDLQDHAPERRVLWKVQPGLQARGDARLLRMALENLLGNAWKFSGQRAAAEIEFLSLPGACGESVFCVRDNGKAGFDMAYAGKLFGNFQRLHGESEFPGTGIGLANVSRIVARHGGRVWAEGREGSGAAFYFTLGMLSHDA